MHSWMLFALGEGLAKTLSRLLQKPLGPLTGGLPGSIVSTLSIGGVQCILGLATALIRGKSLTVSRGQIAGGLFFGMFATVNTILAVLTFTYPGADVGISTFLVAISIVPGAILDWLIFGTKLAARQVAGIFVFLVAGWAMFNFPSLAMLKDFPTWAILSLSIAGLLSISNVITRKVSLEKVSDPSIYNFWVGLSTVVVSSVAGVVAGSFTRIFPILFFEIAGFVGLIVFLMISSNLLGYKGGGTIALKTIIVQGVYLVTAVFLGVLFFHEPLTVGKLAGTLLFFFAFTLTDQRTWGVITRST